MSKAVVKRRNQLVALSNDDAEQDVIPPTAPVAGAPSTRSDDVLQSAQDCVASPAQLPPSQSWLDIVGHLGRLLSAAAHLFEQITAATSTGCHDMLPAAVMTEATFLPFRGLQPCSARSSILGDWPVLQQQPPTSKVEDASKF
ncbi:unnamed protein product [Lampetra fluviatilis]